MTGVLITGGGGFIGQKLAKKLAQRGELCGQPIHSLTLVDLETPTVPDTEFPSMGLGMDLAAPDTARIRPVCLP